MRRDARSIMAVMFGEIDTISASVNAIIRENEKENENSRF